jgi:predicted RNase H-like HicB family nuclease
MYKYEVIVYWGDEDEAYIAEVPELPGAWQTARLMKKP